MPASPLPRVQRASMQAPAVIMRASAPSDGSCSALCAPHTSGSTGWAQQAVAKTVGCSYTCLALHALAGRAGDARARVYDHRRAAADGHAPPPGAGRDRDAQQDCRGCLGKWLAQEGLAGREGDRSGRPCDPATIEDVVPGNPAEAWTAMFPERPWEASVERRGHLTRLEPPLPRRVGNAEDARKVTADGESHSAWTRDSHDEALLPWTPERLDSRQQRLGVRAVPRWRADGA
jgi:hypothetical protein